jgi:hypothetical protein
MPIIAVVVLTLVFWVAYWFVRMGGIDHFQARAQERKDTARLAKARESERIAPLRAVDDPRDAAIILMLLAVRCAGDPTREQIATIERIAGTTFGFERDLAERMAQARFIASRAVIWSRWSSRSRKSKAPCRRRPRRSRCSSVEPDLHRRVENASPFAPLFRFAQQRGFSTSSGRFPAPARGPQ